jgi:hypothetical protein
MSQVLDLWAKHLIFPPTPADFTMRRTIHGLDPSILATEKVPFSTALANRHSKMAPLVSSIFTFVKEWHKQAGNRAHDDVYSKNSSVGTAIDGIIFFPNADSSKRNRCSSIASSISILVIGCMGLAYQSLRTVRRDLTASDVLDLPRPKGTILFCSS